MHLLVFPCPFRVDFASLLHAYLSAYINLRAKTVLVPIRQSITSVAEATHMATVTNRNYPMLLVHGDTDDGHPNAIFATKSILYFDIKLAVSFL